MKKSNSIFFAVIFFIILAVLMSCLAGCSININRPATHTTKPDSHGTTDVTTDVPTDVTADLPKNTTYSVTIANGIKHGTVAADKTEVIAGTVITLTVTAETGYELKWGDVTDSDGKSISVTEEGRFTMPASDVTVYAGFEALPPNKYTVTFVSNGGSPIKQQSVEENKKVAKPTDPAMMGYTFAGWFTDSACTAVYDFDTAVTAHITLYAKWTPSTDTMYAVVHYKQNVNDDGYTIVQDDTEILTGTTETDTAAAAKSYEGFEALPFEQKKIAANDLTVVEIKYNRKTVTLTFKIIGGEWSDGTAADKTVSGRYGAMVSAPVIPPKDNYGSSWNKPVQGTFRSDETYTAQYLSGMVNYTVKHRFEFANGMGYYDIDEPCCGPIGDKTSAEPKDYEYCVIQPFKQQTIKGDGSTVVEICYKREIVTMYFDTDGGSETEPISGRYYDDFTPPPAPTKQGYIFAGWDPPLPIYEYDDENGNHYTFSTLIPITEKVLWTPASDTKYTVEYYKHNLLDDGFTLSAEDTETLTGITEEQTTVAAKKLAGLTARPVEQQTIAADGSTVVKVYYDRDDVYVTKDDLEEKIAAIKTSCRIIVSGELDARDPTPKNMRVKKDSARYYNTDMPNLTPEQEKEIEESPLPNSFDIMTCALNTLSRDIDIIMDLSNVTGLTKVPDCAFESIMPHPLLLLLADSIQVNDGSPLLIIGRIVTVILPDSVQSIGKNAFRDCYKLKEINTPASLTDIGENAFQGCTSLTNVPTVGGGD